MGVLTDVTNLNRAGLPKENHPEFSLLICVSFLTTFLHFLASIAVLCYLFLVVKECQ